MSHGLVIVIGMYTFVDILTGYVDHPKCVHY